MSFILDALKKSESDRQRQSGPALFEVKVTPPKPRFPTWAVALAALLVLNIAFGAWVLLRHPPPPPPSPPPPAAEAAPRTAVPTLQSMPPPAAPQSAVSQLPVLAPAAAPAAAPDAAAHAATTTPPEPVLSDAQSRNAAANPDDYAPAVAPGKNDDTAHVRTASESGFKSYVDTQAEPNAHLPALRVDLHVYAARPEERFVLINMHRLHEGETLPEGVRIESITPEGVVVSYQGTKYMLDERE